MVLHTSPERFWPDSSNGHRIMIFSLKGMGCRKWYVASCKPSSTSLIPLQTALTIIRPFPGALNGRFKDVPGSLGVLLPGMEARIVREDGSEADFNEVGELWLKGETVVSGYLNDSQATQRTFINGWLRTGDYFKVDEGHYF